MRSCSPYRVFIAITLCILIAMLNGTLFAAEQSQNVGVVLLHGKTGQPNFVGAGVIGPLEQAGFLVMVPEMPWSRDRYIDKTYEEALTEIEQAAEKLRKNGATKVVVAGHSMGANAALAYAAYHGGVDGVILLAPGHIPDTRVSIDRFAADVARAKAMIESGNENGFAVFGDWNNGKAYTRNMKASIYYSYFSPDGTAAMGKAATIVEQKIPILYVAGSQDPLTKFLGKRYLYDKLPENLLTRYVVVSADHLGTPVAAVGDIITWLHLVASK